MQRRTDAPPAAEPGGVRMAGPRQGEMKQLAAALNRRPVQAAAAANQAGLPESLKAGVEALSGLSMDPVRVHRNSARPARLQAHAYAQGIEIHLGPGQDHHLPHEAWHVVQQAQGRVRPTLQTKGGVSVNTDATLEAEADAMGAMALAGDKRTEPGPLDRSAGAAPGREVVAQPKFFMGYEPLGLETLGPAWEELKTWDTSHRLAGAQQEFSDKAQSNSDEGAFYTWVRGKVEDETRWPAAEAILLRHGIREGALRRAMRAVGSIDRLPIPENSPLAETEAVKNEELADAPEAQEAPPSPRAESRILQIPRLVHLIDSAFGADPFLDHELKWLGVVIDTRFLAYRERDALYIPPEPHDHGDDPTPYAEVVRDLSLGHAERLVVILALAPYVAPETLDPFFLLNDSTGRAFTEFGGVKGHAHSGFLPTIETALFLLAGGDRTSRLGFESLFAPAHGLTARGLLRIDRRYPDEPPNAGTLRLTDLGLHRLLHGGEYKPRPGADFPAALVTTPLEWNDLVLDDLAREQLELVSLWIENARTIMETWGLAKRLKPGYRCLFHGEPGTGKTLTACLLGKRHDLPVYRVDISQIISKWIGETEKNLAVLFDQAEHRDWILLFDEADALFGKRTDVTSANDRAANQQIAYLLQRLETYSGLAILATNQQTFLDDAFARRFQSSIRFPMPVADQRARLWRDCFQGAGFKLAADIDFDVLAARYEIAGGAIINVLRHAALLATRRRPPTVHAHDLIDGALREMRKDGRYPTV